jgi:opacity protein-like surface antigen
MIFKKSIILIILIILISSASVFAGDFLGNLTYSGQYNFVEQNLSNALNLDLNYIHNFTDEVFAEGDLVIRYSDKSSPTNPFMIIPKEIYIGTYDLIPNLDLRAGLLIVNWGSSDMFSPLDNFNPLPSGMSFTSMTQKNGVLAADATYYFNDITYLQAIVLPSFVPSYMPEKYEEQIYLSMFAPQFQAQGIEITSVNITHAFPENPVWGIKLGKSFTSFDAAISYYNGYYFNGYPETMQPVPGDSGMALNLGLGYPKKSVFGLEFQGDFPGIEGATLRGDLAYIVPQHWQVQGEDILKDPYIKAVIGADYTTSFDLYLNVGLIWGFAFEEGDQCSPYTSLNARKDLEDSKLTPNYLGIISLQDGSMINSVGASYDFTDDFSITLSYVSVLGDQNSKLGQMKSAEGIYLMGEWSF